MAAHVAIDQLRRKSMFGIDATYRVAAVGECHAVMQVVDAAGLPAGMEIRMELPAVASMDVVDVRGEVDRALEQMLSGASAAPAAA